MKSLTLKSLVLAASLAFAAMSVNAAPTISVDTAPSLNEEHYDFGNTSLSPSFADYIAVSFGGIRDLVGAISGTSTGTIDFLKFNIVSFDKGTTVATGSIDNSKVKFAFADLESTSLAGGSYWLYVTGTKTGSTASYSGSISAISPVPEAETYSMMLAGLGLMGFVARRRKV